MDSFVMLALTLILVLTAEFVNGWTDAPNAIATLVGTKTLPLRSAIILAVVGNMLGAWLFGTMVAETIGRDTLNPHVITLPVLAAAMVSIVAWSMFAWHFKIPTSESHGLLAGLSGAGIAYALWDSFPQWRNHLLAGDAHAIWGVMRDSLSLVLVQKGWSKALGGLIIAPPVALIGSFILGGTIQTIFNQRMSLVGFRKLFRWLQIISSGVMALSHGANDVQKFMGVFALALLLSGVTQSFYVPWWTILICVIVIGIGTACGGRRIIHKMTREMLKHDPQPYQGFAAEAVADGTILLSTALAVPLSTTVTSNFGIMGAALAYDLREVRWNIVAGMMYAWVLTFPVCGGISFIVTLATLIIFS